MFCVLGAAATDRLIKTAVVDVQQARSLAGIVAEIPVSYIDEIED